MIAWVVSAAWATRAVPCVAPARFAPKLSLNQKNGSSTIAKLKKHHIITAKSTGTRKASNDPSSSSRER